MRRHPATTGRLHRLRGPLLVLLMLAAAAARAEPPRTALVVRRFDLQTPDRVTIAASYFPAAAAGPLPAALLVHGYGGTREEWQFFAHQLQTNGIAALIIEMRGHGGSTRQMTPVGPLTLDHLKLQPADFRDMLIEINSAVDWLAHQDGIDRRRLAVVASSISANLAVRYALFNEEIAALALLSPGLVYREVRTDDAIGLVGPVPIKVLVAEQDGFAFESCKRLQALRRQAKPDAPPLELATYPGNLHGTRIVRALPAAAADLLAWLRRVLASPPPAP